MRHALSAVLASTPSFDTQFESQADLLARLEETLLDGDEKAGRRLAHRLLNEMQDRFSEEQKLLRRLCHPDLRQHARNHEAALVLLEQVESALAGGNVGMALTRLAAVRLFLAEVLSEQETAIADFVPSRNTDVPGYA